MRTLRRFLIQSLALFGLWACDSSGTTAPVLLDAELQADFEGASLESWNQTTPGTFDIRVRTDTNSDFSRWYSYKVRGGAGEALTFRITNADNLSAADAFSFNQPAVSVDGGATWDRIERTSYSGGVFSFNYTPPVDGAWIALGPVYNYSRWEGLVSQIQDHPAVDSLEVIAQTLQGRALHLVKITDPSVDDSLKGAVWATARQHPAEVGGSWLAEGMLRWLLSDDPQARSLLTRAVFYMVPFMNPDGVALGNYRVNSVGANLNREWANQDPATAPTVAAVTRRIQAFVDSGKRFEFFVDFHAYSSLRKNFFFYSGLDRASPEEVQEIEAIMDRFQELNGDFTRSESSPSGDDTRLARGWVFETFGTQAVTFECSYQDITYGPRAGMYMTPNRYLELGEGLGKTLAEVVFGVGG